MAITPAFIWACFIGNDDAELAEILGAPLVKAYVMQIPAEIMRKYGFAHPLGDNWRGYQDINPAVLPRERIVAMLKKVNVEGIRAIVPNGTPRKTARILKGFVEAGKQVPKILDYGGMAGLKYAARSADKVREAEN